MMLGTGASWKASVPIEVVATWPQMTTMGTESAWLSRTGVTVLVAPGPEVTKATPDSPAGARKPRGHESGALLVGRDDQRHGGLVLLVVAEYGIVNRQYRAAAVAEHRVHALVGQHLDEHFRTRHAGAGQRVSALVQHVIAVFHAQSLAVLALAPKCHRPVSSEGPCGTSLQFFCRTKPGR